jgi:hypothetical protein
LTKLLLLCVRCPTVCNQRYDLRFVPSRAQELDIRSGSLVLLYVSGSAPRYVRWCSSSALCLHTTPHHHISCCCSDVCGLCFFCCLLLLQLKPLAWALYGPGNLYVLRRNLTIHSTYKPLGLMDFQLLERKVLLEAGVTVTFNNILLQNIRCVCCACVEPCCACVEPCCACVEPCCAAAGAAGQRTVCIQLLGKVCSEATQAQLLAAAKRRRQMRVGLCIYVAWSCVLDSKRSHS